MAPALAASSTTRMTGGVQYENPSARAKRASILGWWAGAGGPTLTRPVLHDPDLGVLTHGRIGRVIAIVVASY
jgi:hypothetical protein